MTRFDRMSVLVVLSLALVACGGGSAGSDGDTTAPTPPPNQAPTADAGPDQTVAAGDTVRLAGSGSDADEPASSLSYAWTQVSGPAVVLTGAELAEASFTAPTVSGETILTFRLTVTDSDGVSATDSVDVIVTEAAAAVAISGKVEFEFVPRGPIGTGLDFAATTVRPIRGATVQAIDAASDTVLATTTSSDTGSYALTVPGATDVFIRVRAELKRSGTPSWDVEVRDNTSNTGLALGQRPIYVLDGAPASSGGSDSTRNLLAATGWDDAAGAYTEPRAAAPFSVLDTIYTAIRLVTDTDAAVRFAPLDAFWSVNNTPNDGDLDVDIGEIRTSFYRPAIDSLFLLGDANADTEEFDTHVIAHEWGHYFEDTLSRSDSSGGRHSLNNRLDARLAFGEGWGNAVAGMIMGDPVYFDTFFRIFGQDSFGFSVENLRSPTPVGWYNEASVQEILWDLFDANADGGDRIALGFAGLYDVLINEQRATPAFTTIFSFIHELKQNNPTQAAGIDAILADHAIDPIADVWGDSETTNDPGSTALLPVHTELFLGSGPVNVCVSREFDPNDDGNKLGTFRYLRFDVASAGDYRVSVTTTNPPSAPAGEPEQYSDPDFFVVRSGALIDIGGTGTQNAETLDLLGLAAGAYTIELLEAGFPNVYEFTSGSADFAQTTMCFDVTLTQF